MSENIIVALITTIGLLVGGIISASATIQAAKIKENVNSTSSNKSLVWIRMAIGAMTGAFATLFALYLLGMFPPAKTLAASGIWEGITTGISEGSPISERETTVSIPNDCEVGDTCGIASFKDACNYQMTLNDIQENIYSFDVYPLSGEDFCLRSSAQQHIELRLLSEDQMTIHYESVHDDGTITIRDGVLKKSK